MTYGSDMSFPYYPALDGSALEGVAYFGVAGQNPVTNPVTVFWDSAGTQPAAQPVTISKGRTVRSDGTPARVWVASDYSVLVQDTLGRQVVFEPNQPLTIAALNAINQATAQVGLATAQAGAAATSATGAAGSATASSNYAAAAATGAKFYNTIALGIAGTTSANTFGVIAGGSDGLTRPTIYRNDSGTATKLYAVIPGSEIEPFEATQELLTTAVGSVLAATTIGSTAPNLTVFGGGQIIGNPTLVAGNGVLSSVSIRASGAGNGEIHVYDRTSSTTWRCTYVIPVTFSAAGVSTFQAIDGTLPKTIHVQPGSFVAYKEGTSLLSGNASGGGGINVVNGDAGVASSVTVTFSGGFDPAISYTFQALPAGGSLLSQINTAAAVGSELVAAAIANDYSTKTIGSTTANGTNFGASQTLAVPGTVQAAALLSSVSIRASGAGNGEIHVYDQVNQTTWKCTYVVAVSFLDIGVRTFQVADGSLPSNIRMKPGSFVAFKEGTALLRGNPTGGPGLIIVSGDTGVGGNVLITSSAAFDPAISYTFQALPDGTSALDAQIAAAVSSAIDRMGANYELTPAPTTRKAYVLGDSTVAANGAGQSAIIDLLNTVRVKNSIAVPGDTIAQQKTRWQALTIVVANVAYVVIQIGLNDLDPGSHTSASTIAAYQDLVTTVRASVGATKKILVSKMTPCRQRLIDLYGTTNGPLAQQIWVDLNNAIAGSGGSPITGVDGRITAHVPLLDDGSGNLIAAYDTGDHIHPNDLGRTIYAQTWFTAIAATGLLP